MAKVTDLSAIQQAISDIIDEKCPDLVSYIGREAAIFCVLAVYQNNDICCGYGQDFYTLVPLQVNGHPSKVSVIAYTDGVSVIIDNQMSRYQDSLPLCGYEDLAEDIHAILMYIQTAIDRINARG